MDIKEAKEIIIEEAKKIIKKIEKSYYLSPYYEEDKENMEDLIELLEYSGI